eukprot:2872654-Amphidinium_carterae.1
MHISLQPTADARIKEVWELRLHYDVYDPLEPPWQNSGNDIMRAIAVQDNGRTRSSDREEKSAYQYRSKVF